jgi:hypothetical protein
MIPAVKNMSENEQIKLLTGYRIEGKTFREIKQLTGMSLGTITNKLKDEDAKKIIQDSVKHHIEMLPLTLLRHDDLLLSDDETIALNAVKLSYQITGVMPTHASNQYLINIYNDHRQQVINPIISGLLAGNKQLPGIHDDDIIDIEDN